MELGPEQSILPEVGWWLDCESYKNRVLTPEVIQALKRAFIYWSVETNPFISYQSAISTQLCCRVSFPLSRLRRQQSGQDVLELQKEKHRDGVTILTRKAVVL